MSDSLPGSSTGAASGPSLGATSGTSPGATSPSPALLRRLFRGSWRVLDTSRRVVVNLAFLLVVFVLALVWLTSGPRKLADKTVLVLDLRGALVEQEVGSSRDMVLARVRGDARSTTRLRDVLAVLKAGAADPRIGSALLITDDLQGAGLPMLHEVALALQRFKAAGKPIIAWGSRYDQRQYYLAAQASQVYLHPMGQVLLEGFGGYNNYYRDALDKLGVSVHVLKAGKFKSFGEPYTANGPSPESVEATNYLLNALWAGYTADVEKARKLPAGSIMAGINKLPELMKAVEGNAAKLAVDGKLVDGLKTRDELRDAMLKLGARDDAIKSFRQVGLDEYLAQVKPPASGAVVGVVVAMGDISDGNANAGQIGGLSTAALVRQAREDDNIKAVVLRVDSPGGSAFGAELIRRELELTRAAGKPVVVSMGNVAASGGYWIAMAADEVVADASTVTGSIGVFTLRPTADKALDKLGVHTAGSTTTWLRGAYDPRRPLDPRLADVIQSSINRIYLDFTTKVAQARKTTQAKIDEVAQGRVWTGVQAKERGLIDTVGSYEDALKSAAKRAKLGDDYRVAYIERGISRFDKLLRFVGLGVSVDLQLAWLPSWLSDVLGLPSGSVDGLQFAPQAARDMAADLAWLAQAAGTAGVDASHLSPLTHCLCRQP